MNNEIEIEHVRSSSLSSFPDAQSTESMCSTEKYRPNEIEKFLKLSIESKQYIVIRNSSLLIKSEVWNTFGFPAKQQSDGSYRSIVGYVSCFHCFKTIVYDSSTMVKVHSINTFDERKRWCKEAIEKHLKKNLFIGLVPQYDLSTCSLTMALLTSSEKQSISVSAYFHKEISHVFSRNR